MKDGPFGAKIPFEDRFLIRELWLPSRRLRQRGRLGYGGGFYDRTLELLRSRRPTLAVSCLRRSIAERLPCSQLTSPLICLLQRTKF